MDIAKVLYVINGWEKLDTRGAVTFFQDTIDGSARQKERQLYPKPKLYFSEDAATIKKNILTAVNNWNTDGIQTYVNFIERLFKEDNFFLGILDEVSTLSEYIETTIELLRDLKTRFDLDNDTEKI